jgi:hypothetical protein
VQIEAPITKSRDRADIFDEMLRSGELFTWAHGRTDSPVAHTAMARFGREAVKHCFVAEQQRKFFHWELEFPEVFYGRQDGTRATVERLQKAGFDSIIGNPPWVGTKQIDKQLREYFWSTKRDLLIEEMDLYELFLDSMSHIAKPIGCIAFVLPTTWYTNRAFENLRKSVIFGRLNPTVLVDFPYRFFPFPDVNKETCVLALVRGQSVGGFRFLQVVKDDLIQNPVVDDRFLVGSKEIADVLTKPGAMLFLRETELTRTLDNSGERLSAYIEAHKGWMSIPPRTKTAKGTYEQELFTGHELAKDLDLRKICKPCARGEDTQHYYFAWELDKDSEMYVNAEGIDAETAKWHYQKKVICQRITGQNNRRLIAACDDSGNVVAHPSTNLLFFLQRRPPKALHRLVALLNADCLNEYYKTLFGEANTNITADVLHYLPVPKEFFDGESRLHQELDEQIESLRKQITQGQTGKGSLETGEAERISELVGEMFGLRADMTVRRS